MPGRLCWGCWPTCHASTAGRSPSTPATPALTGREHLLGRAVWDHDAVRDDVRAYVVEHLGEDAAVLVVDETGDLKKGTTTVGVKRQYTGTAGRIDNAQVAVYLWCTPARRGTR
jgi:SRSO17 transposase